MAVAVTTGTVLIAANSRPPVTWLFLVAVSSLLIGAAVFLSLPIIHCFATPMLTGLAGVWSKEVWVRFPNREYVALFAKTSKPDGVEKGS
jgi:hypothetical protein